MFKLLSVEMGADYKHGYDPGAKPGIKCLVTMQTGKNPWDKTEFNLPPEAVKRVVKVALEETQALIAIDHDSIDVDGAPGTPKPEIKPEPGVIYDDGKDAPL